MDLLTEFQTYNRTRAAAYLVRKGVPEWVAETCAATDIITTGTTWHPTLDAGQGAIIVPVTDAYENYIDLVAYLPNDPKRMYLRNGTGQFLGDLHLNWARVYQRTCIVHENACQWLLAGMEGCVPLSTDAMTLFMGCTEINTTPEMFNSILRQLDLSYPRPKLVGA